MRLLEGRKLAAAAIGYVLALIFGALTMTGRPLLSFLSAGVLVLPALLLLYCGFQFESWILFYLAVGLTLGFLISGFTFGIPYRDAESFCAEDAVVCGEVMEVTQASDSYTEFLFRVTDINDKKTNTVALSHCYYSVGLKAGDRLTGKVSLTEALPQSGHWLTKNEIYTNGIVLTAEFSDMDVAHTGHDNVFTVIADAVSDSFQEYMTDSAASLSSALLLGRKKDLPPTVIRDFARVGASHILAVSGMHLSVLTGAVALLLLAFSVSRRKLAVILSVFVIFYMALVGFTASVCRSGIMVIFLNLSHLVRRRRDSVTTLFAALFLICLVHPGAVFSIGLWLSFFATLSLILLASILKKCKWFEKTRIRKCIFAVLFSVLSSVGAILMTMPICAAFFGEISLFGVVSSLILSPLCEGIMILALLTLPTFGVIAPLVNALSRFCLHLVSHLADRRGILLSLRPAYAKIAVSLLAIGLFVLLFGSFKRKSGLRILAIVTLLSGGILVGGKIVADHEMDRYFTVGYVSDTAGEVIAVFRDGRVLLADISYGGKAPLLSAFDLAQELGVCEAEVLMLTHYHTRHLTSVSYFIQREKIRQLWLPAPQNEDEQAIALGLYDIAQAFGVSVSWLDSGAPQNFEDVEVETSVRVWLKRSTQPVLAFRVSCGDASLNYYGAAALEGGVILPDAAVSLYGEHGPKYKTIFHPSIPAWVSDAAVEYCDSPDVHHLADHFVFRIS